MEARSPKQKKKRKRERNRNHESEKTERSYAASVQIHKLHRVLLLHSEIKKKYIALMFFAQVAITFFSICASLKNGLSILT